MEEMSRQGSTSDMRPEESDFYKVTKCTRAATEKLQTEQQGITEDF